MNEPNLEQMDKILEQFDTQRSAGKRVDSNVEWKGFLHCHVACIW